MEGDELVKYTKAFGNYHKLNQRIVVPRNDRELIKKYLLEDICCEDDRPEVLLEYLIVALNCSQEHFCIVLEVIKEIDVLDGVLTEYLKTNKVLNTWFIVTLRRNIDLKVEEEWVTALDDESVTDLFYLFYEDV